MEQIKKELVQRVVVMVIDHLMREYDISIWELDKFNDHECERD